MKYICIKIGLVIVALFGGVATASDLPDCPSSLGAPISNCFGEHTWKGGARYIGEWKGGAYNGKGYLTWASGNTYFGEWMNGMRHGQGIYTSVGGAVEEGIFDYGAFKYAKTPTTPVPVVRTASNLPDCPSDTDWRSWK